MILTTSILKSFGLPIDADMDDALLASAIENAELITIKEAVGADVLSSISALEATDPALIGGEVNGEIVAGFLRADAYLSMAHLLFLCDTQVTSFGAVKKKTEYSNGVDPWNAAKRYEAMGLHMLRDLCRAEEWEYNTPSTITTEL